MSEATSTNTSRKPRFYRRKWFIWPVGIVVGIGVLTLLAFNLSPRPGAFLIKAVFTDGAEKTKAVMVPYAPTSGVASLRNETYRADDRYAKLDVFFPDMLDEGEKLPVLIWTHGGAWVSGDKDDDAPYFEIIANEGFTVIGLNYSPGPHKTYPTAIHQISDALLYIQENADRFHADTDRIVMAGDSAGAQLTSQIAAIITNPEFAAELGITPALKPDQLRGVILNCGIYDMAAFTDSSNLPHTAFADILVWGVDTTTWAYTGSKSKDSTALAQMSTLNHVTADFPTTWISGGNGDPLTAGQSKPFAEKLESLGVPVTPLFFPDDHEPKLGHEYQFQLDTEDAQTALTGMLTFLREQTK